MDTQNHWAHAQSRRRMYAQGIATAAVLVTGVIASATAGGASATSAHRGTAASHLTAAPRSGVSTPAPGPTQHAGSPSYLHPKGHPFNPTPDGVIPATGRHAGHTVVHLRHPAGEPWSRLLVAAPAGWTTTYTPKALTPKELSKGTPNPAMAAKGLRFDGFRRGVIRTVRGSHYGVVEQIWQFRRQSGAQAVFLASVDVARARDHGRAGRTFLIGDHDDFGYIAAGLDSTGYHYGVGLALDGDMFVEIRVFGTAPVKRDEVKAQLQRAERPVARGISHLGLVDRPAGASSPGSSSVST